MSPRTMNRWGEGARLRDEILQATARLLARAAVRDAITLRAIARETGIAAPSIYKHFADRDAVLDAVVAATFEQLDAACGSAYEHAVGGSERVRAVSRAYVDFAAEHPDEYRILFERSAANTSSPRGPYPAGLHAFQYLTDAVAQMRAEAGAPAGTDPVRDAEVLWVALHGAVTLVPATPGFPWSSTDVIVSTLLDRFCGPADAGTSAADGPAAHP